MTTLSFCTTLLGLSAFGSLSPRDAIAGGGPELGYSVSSAGDVNGDGLTDVIAGAPGYGPGGTTSVYLYYGRTDRNLTPTLLAQESGSGYENFGSCVTTCGDVNGDGYDDVAIGNRSWNSSRGNVRLYFGSATTPTLSATWKPEGESANDQFGTVVAYAGDVNRDGYDDILVGAPFYADGLFTTGRAYLYLGSATGPSTTPAWTFTGSTLSGNGPIGENISAAGDVNGDGYADVLIADEGYDFLLQYGHVYLFLGGPGGLSASPSWGVGGRAATDDFGKDACGVGDVNGDGYSDIAIGASGLDSLGTNTGVVYVYNGKTGVPSGDPSATMFTGRIGGQFGNKLFTAGDVNADGFADLVVTSQRSSAPNSFVSVYAGSGSGLESAAFSESLSVETYFGFAIGSAGDMDGDGFGDIVIGDPFIGITDPSLEEGAVSFHFGHMGKLSTARVDVTNGVAGSHAGYVGTAGDVNADGFDDMLVGAPDNTAGGRVRLYYGNTSFAFTSYADLVPQSSDLHMGRSVAPAGDVNGDGYGDIIAGGFWDTGSLIGAVTVYLGSATGIVTTPLSFNNRSAGAVGTSVAGAGDVNGDGYCDTIYGAPDYINGGTGRVAVRHGSSTGPVDPESWYAAGPHAGSEFGASVASAGDVNGDGYSDVIIGAPGVMYQASTGGAAYVYLGSPTGITGSYVQLRPVLMNSRFGAAVAGIGDVNGDGLSDVLVGAPDYDGPEGVEGAAFVYLGSGPLGVRSKPYWTRFGGQAGSNFGAAVGPAGDVDLDGYPDFLVGAPLYTDKDPEQGRADLYRGGPSMTFAGPYWTAEGVSDNWHFGSSVSTAGDFNRDGVPDVIVGSPDGANTGGDERGVVNFYPGGDRDGMDRWFRVEKSGGDPLGFLGKLPGPSFRFKSLYHSAAGRMRSYTEVEFERVATLFGTSSIDQLTTVDLTSAPGAAGIPGSTYSQLSLYSGLLSPGTRYHWRARLRSKSPYFAHSPWITPSWNSANEMDFTSGGTYVAVDDRSTGGAFVVEAPRPNPTRESVSTTFWLPRPGHVTASVYDLAGRRVATIAGEDFTAGPHTLRWDLGDAHGHRVTAGLYLFRVTGAGSEGTRKVIVLD